MSFDPEQTVKVYDLDNTIMIEQGDLRTSVEEIGLKDCTYHWNDGYVEGHMMTCPSLGMHYHSANQEDRRGFLATYCYVVKLLPQDNKPNESAYFSANLNTDGKTLFFFHSSVPIT
jgi:hypothetical protein